MRDSDRNKRCVHEHKSQESTYNCLKMLITRERLDLATYNCDSSLTLISCIFVPNFLAIGLVSSVLGSKNFSQKFDLERGLI